MSNVTRRWWRRNKYRPDPKMVTAIFTFLGAVLAVVKEVIAALRK